MMQKIVYTIEVRFNRVNTWLVTDDESSSRDFTIHTLKKV